MDWHAPQSKIALAYAALGWHVAPCHHIVGGKCSCGSHDCSKGKHPRTRSGLKDATTDAEVINDWWRRWPDANIAIRTGAISGIIVVDVDLPDGPEVIHRLQDDHGELPATPHNITGSGGRQLIFAHPGGVVGNRTKFVVGLDFRGDEGYIIAPPSNHVSGRRYTWLHDHTPSDIAPPVMPDWLMAMIKSPDRPRPSATTSAAPSGLDALMRVATSYVAKMTPAAQGQRNGSAYNAAGHLFAFTTADGHRLGEQHVADLLRVWNYRNDPPLAEAELLACVKSGMKNGTPRPDKIIQQHQQHHEDAVDRATRKTIARRINQARRRT